MRFLSIKIKEGFFERTIDFSGGANLIFSLENSKGKTTLLRCLLYSIGYAVPNTKKIHFDKCEIKTIIYTERFGNISLKRISKDAISVEAQGTVTTFVLPDQQYELHKIVFGSDNKNILSNILGAFYVDQEKGWTLLNRGIVIGGIRFSIEELIRGISDQDCTELLCIKEKLQDNLSKYKQMHSIAKYRDSVAKSNGSLASLKYDETVSAKRNNLLLEQQTLQAELSRIDKILKDNKLFKNFVSEIKLLVKTPDGQTIPVNDTNIVGLTDTIEFLIAKRKIVSAKLSNIARQLVLMQNELKREQEQEEFFSSEDIVDIFNREILSIPINEIAINEEIQKTEKELKFVRGQIDRKTKSDDIIIASMYNNVAKYATELGVADGDSIAASYLFTSNLKELSGAVLHKTVFAFRLAYILEIEKKLGIKLPIILDSPSGKEIDRKNLECMINILKRDFKDNQIIIASIYKYNFDDINIIPIVNRLVE
ncbi:MAG: hypothetical protein J6W27_02290 [Alphaproteobacteria bacterium]|nr:hypothetical protein [Alphaproteobacteria bacterium]